MTVSYVFHPVPYKGPVKNNQIYLGLGELEGCAFELSGGDLIRSILESAQKIDDTLESETIFINLPIMPGIDIMAGAYLIKHYIETGRFPKAAGRLFRHNQQRKVLPGQTKHLYSILYTYGNRQILRQCPAGRAFGAAHGKIRNSF